MTIRDLLSTFMMPLFTFCRMLLWHKTACGLVKKITLSFFLLYAALHSDRVFSQINAAPYIVVLGVAQDAGFPQAGCQRACCTQAWREAVLRRHVTALALVDPQSSQRWLIDATPDFPEQLRRLDEVAATAHASFLNGIFLTHGHIGHYTGLMHLGREVMGAKALPVYVMPRMRTFLSTHGPWEQLVRLQNVKLQPLQHDSTITLNAGVTITPILVPHRDEYTETVGFRIAGPRHAVLFIPDIDKWEKWPRRIEDEIAQVEVAYLDGTFYAEGEIPGRNMAEIPHPFIVESMARFSSLPPHERAKIRFLHLNHTNPALILDSAAWRNLHNAGLFVAQEGEQFEL